MMLLTVLCVLMRSVLTITAAQPIAPQQSQIKFLNLELNHESTPCPEPSVCVGSLSLVRSGIWRRADRESYYPHQNTEASVQRSAVASEPITDENDL